MGVLAVPSFTQLSYNVFISKPEKRSLSTTAAPDTIILNTWLNAQPKHIAKYTSKYRTMYPNVTIFMVTSKWTDFAYRTKAMQESSLEPVIYHLQSLPSTSKVLLHIFSNGGAHVAATMALSYERKTNKPLPISKMILDSSPGQHSYHKSTTAFIVMLPSWQKNPIFRLWGLFLIYVGFAINALIADVILRSEDSTIITGRRLIDRRYWGQDMERLYVYGDLDPMVTSEDVMGHAKRAEAEGYKVTQERFPEGKHCASATADPVRYWGAVERLMASAGDNEKY